ncbi:MAG TPA: hypothetical protein VKE74_24095 [Gemmataceae bacterium]|nr:hypothetical protein [Gemmataceae bacterium]
MICRTAVELICRSVDAPLSAGERVGLGVHTLFCGPCRRFRGQMGRLDVACEAAAREDPPGGETLSAAARERIVAALRDS